MKESVSVPDRLIDVAEQLFGEQGLESVSLRQISSAAGTGNNYAVQYHFGDLAGLIRAIFEKRIPVMEMRRAQYLSKAKEDGRLGDTRALMEVLYLPTIDHKNENGERAFARFFLALLNSPQNVEASSGVFNKMAVAAHTVDLIASLNSAIPSSLLMERQRLISLMVLNSVFNRLAPWAGAKEDSVLIENVLDMATAALLAPVSKSVSSLVKSSTTSLSK